MTQTEWIETHIREAAGLLPAQGPITAFAFLNTLQALENLPFEAGLRRGQELFGYETYLSEERYREKLARGRIRLEDLSETLKRDLGQRCQTAVGPSGNLFNLRLSMLEYSMRMAPESELRWFMAETDALTRYREEVSPESGEIRTNETRRWIEEEILPNTASPWHDFFPELRGRQVEKWTHAQWTAFALHALWQVCREGVRSLPLVTTSVSMIRHRDLLLAATGFDCDRLLQEVMIPFCAGFLDQGLATWVLPHREQGLWKTFVSLYSSGSSVETWLRPLRAELHRLSGLTPAQVVEDSLEQLGISREDAPEYLTRELLAMRGWAGMIWQAEDRGDRIARPVPPGTLLEYMAVRLVLLRMALLDAMRKESLGDRKLTELRALLGERIPPVESTSIDQRAFEVFQLAQLQQWSAAALSHLSEDQWKSLIHEIEEFDGHSRRRIFHLAFERRFRTQALDALSLHNQEPRPAKSESPLFQSVYCIDAREESFRRHLEEVCPRAETFGAAGFFGVAMYFRGVSDAHYQALCPIVVRPRHYVIEEVVYSLAESDRRRSGARRRLATASHRIHLGSRSLTGGALLTAGLGVFASIPLVARVLLPATTSRLRRTLGSVVAPPPVTRLRIERLTEQPGSEGDAIGYTVPEMADVGERILSETGLRTRLSRLVIFFGHGSFCLNNPHKSCYDCGACSGSAGGANARALAAMLNDNRVRRVLAERGLVIPETTVFLGGLHNTATDRFEFFDLDLLPRTHIPDFETARDALEEAARRNAQERCRRFYSAPLDITPNDAHWHVENRSEDLAQTRPEFGNASNAMCVVGRRTLTRELFLDRRSFLVSYDSQLDDAESTILGRILGAVVIVCSGINLQYNFSYIDPAGWGAGTKLPHNVTSLLGVMDGAASDLRSGLPWQGVEIHEPVRCLFAIETTPDSILKIMARNPAVGNILRNGWSQLALIDPETSAVSLYEDGTFVPHECSIDQLRSATSSREFYRGSRDHLDFAEIHPSRVTSPPG